MVERETSMGPTCKGIIRDAIAASESGWIGFETYMNLALYAPQLGYYASGATAIFGPSASTGSDFITAPELGPIFAASLAVQLRQALELTGCDTLWEFGAGSGALAAGLLDALGDLVKRYVIVDLSTTLRARQQARVTAQVPMQSHKLAFASQLPDAIEGVIVGNEVLDAMPVMLLHFDGTQWFERGVVLEGDGFAWADRPTEHRPPVEAAFAPGTTIELPRQALAFVRTLAERHRRGAAFFVDYGFPQDEFYLPERTQGTLMCHRGHRADADPLVDAGLKDITAHVDFSAVAMAAQDAGMTVLGYTSQARFLFNCGIAERMAAADAAARSRAHLLVAEHEMGELFKVLAWAPGSGFDALGFLQGDRTHRL